ncbi:MAG: 2-dehydropantoate 2-reductase [Acidimicrobiia bacterium]|nr:2-dehydropantoate 2-reductase [Acidimicrobiia bacterium]MYG73007.1 2-dehydropantoate 2-reductase [Acidimicrobiia bacterium]MYH95687.1 2-dehydropantoate 2-reductase [Acidimicrobiia bacterium]
MVMMHVVVAGAGGIGGVIAGEIALAGGEVSVVDGWSDHVAAIQRDGLRLVGPAPGVERTTRLPAWHTSECQQVSSIDVLVLAAKAFDNQWLAPLLAPQLAADATVISAQNGVNEPLLAQLLGPERVIGTVVLFAAAATGPGQVRLDWRPTLQIGELDGTLTDRLDQVSTELGPGIDVEVSENIWGAIWSKMVMNCMSNPVNATLGGRARDCREQPGPRRVSLACGSEAVAIGQARGHDIEPVSGIEAERILVGGAGGPGAADLAAQWEATAAELGDVKGSMPTDIERGHKTEIDSFSGFISREGKRLGIPTPANNAVFQMVQEIEAGARLPGPQNLDELLRVLG